MQNYSLTSSSKKPPVKDESGISTTSEQKEPTGSVGSRDFPLFCTSGTQAHSFVFPGNSDGDLTFNF